MDTAESADTCTTASKLSPSLALAAAAASAELAAARSPVTHIPVPHLELQRWGREDAAVLANQASEPPAF